MKRSKYRLGQLVSCTVEGQPNPAYPGNKNLWRFDYDTNVNGQCQLINISAGTGPQPTPCIPPECGGGGPQAPAIPAAPPQPGQQVPLAPEAFKPQGLTPATPGQLPGGQAPTSGGVVIPPGYDGGEESILPMPRPITVLPSSKPTPAPGAQVPLVPPPTYDEGYEEVGSLEADIPPPTSPGGGTGSGNPANVEKIISQWPAFEQKVCREFIQKYGYPTEACESACIWYETAGCSRCACLRNGIAHYWPTVHKDCLCMTVNYKVDPAYYSDIANFDGSVILSRTKGTMTACCDNEAMNFLALNLAHDIAEGEMTWQDAQAMYIEAAKMYKEGKMHPYTLGIMFPTDVGYTGDPGVPVIEGNGY